MSTLGRYVVTRFLSAFVGSLGILVLVVLVVDMLLNLEDVLEVENDLTGVLRFLLLRLASVYLPYLIPVATFTAAFSSVGFAARNHEIVAMKAGGISPRAALIPIFVASGFLAIGALLVNETITVRASAALEDGTETQSGRVELSSGSIWYHTGRYIYNLGRAHGETGRVEDVRVLERNDEGRLVRLIQAESGQRLAPHEWSFDAATVRSFDPEDPAAPPRVQRSPHVTLELAEDRSVELQASEMAGLPVWSLARYLAAGSTDARATSLVHQRLTAPLLVVLFALIAVPLGLRVERTRTLALPALQGVALLFLFLFAREWAASFGAVSSLGAAVGPWVVVLAFGALGLFQLARAET